MKINKKLNSSKTLLLKLDNIYYMILILIIFFIDRLSKLKIISNVSDNNFFINDNINILLIWNTGIGFGLFNSQSFLVYNAITILIGLVILFLFYVAVNSKKIDKLIFSLIIGGALGNIYDRITYKAVPDFIDLHYKDLHWFTFNIADIFISVGIIIFLTNGLFLKNDQ